MNATRKPKAAPSVACVSFQQLITLALDVAESRLQRLFDIYETNDELESEVVDIDHALRVGFERLERMRTCEFKDYSDFDVQWFGVAAILKISFTQLEQQDTNYWRCLKSTVDFFEQMRNTVEFVNIRDSRDLWHAA